MSKGSVLVLGPVEIALHRFKIDQHSLRENEARERECLHDVVDCTSNERRSSIEIVQYDNIRDSPETSRSINPRRIGVSTVLKCVESEEVCGGGNDDCEVIRYVCWTTHVEILKSVDRGASESRSSD